MGKSPEEKIQMMVDGAQPHCDEPLTSAMVCSHAGSMSRALTSIVSSWAGGLTKTSELPNPVLIAVGPTTVYAFKYKPRGFKVKLKKGSEVARWPRSTMKVEVGEPGTVTTQFALLADGQYTYALEATTAMGGAEPFGMFIDALRAPT